MMVSKFRVMDVRNGLRYPVYAIRNDSTGFPHFLIYENNQWKWQSAKHYRPVVNLK